MLVSRLRSWLALRDNPLLPNYTSSKLMVLLQAVSYYAVQFLANIRDALKYVSGTTY